MNTLLDNHGLPVFSRLDPQEVVPAITQVISDNREKLKTLLAQDQLYTWANLIQPIDDMENRLSKVWSPVRHLNAVVNSDELRTAYNECLPLLSEYGTEIGQNRDLYEAYRSIVDGDGFAALDAAQQKTLNDALRDFRLSGVDLPPEKQQRYKEISKRLSELSSQFQDNVLDATQAWEKHVEDESKLDGMTASGIAMAKQAAEQRGKKGWVLTLEYPSYHSVITYANDRALRQEVYRAFSTRASDQGADLKWDNSTVMEEILALKHELSELLGFSNSAERSLARKMASTPDEVLKFLRSLAERAQPQAQDEFAEMDRFGRGVMGLDEVQAWDVPFLSEKMKGNYYSLSQEDLKPYFPVDSVVPGMFELVKQLYGVTIKENSNVDVWHEDVRFYDVFNADGKVQAQFYFDLYARPKKRGGAWMDECMARMLTESELQIPVAYMTCNSTPPVGGQPALFTHDEVITLFHEFGHGLHHMLTRIDYPSVSGISGVEWDAVELPSQFMENFCWEREALDLFARHYETNQPIPEDLFDKVIASKNFQAAMQIVRQLEFGIFDMRIHQEYSLEKGGRIQQILDETRDEVAVVKPPAFNRFQHAFSHIFGGGYAAGYYSYMWAEVLSADAFARFEEEGLFNPEVGHAFLENILEVGGSREAKESFVAFRGREPQIDALLRHRGLAA